MEHREEELVGVYNTVKRPPRKTTHGTTERGGPINAAIAVHTEACGLTAHIVGCHPDEVARAVGSATLNKDQP